MPLPPVGGTFPDPSIAVFAMPPAPPEPEIIEEEEKQPIVIGQPSRFGPTPEPLPEQKPKRAPRRKMAGPKPGGDRPRPTTTRRPRKKD